MRKKTYNTKTEDLEEEEFLDEPELEQPYYEDGLFNESLGLDNYGYSPMPMDKHSDLLKSLTDFSPYLKETINGWLGLRWSEDTGGYIKDENAEPIMNEKCANWCITFLKTYARKNNIITHIGKYEYQYLVEDIIHVIWFNIGLREDFGIKNSGDMIRIGTELQHSAELVLMGAGDGEYNKLLSTATQRNENVSYTGNQNQNNSPYNNIAMPQQQQRQFKDKAIEFLSGKP